MRRVSYILPAHHEVATVLDPPRPRKIGKIQSNTQQYEASPMSVQHVAAFDSDLYLAIPGPGRLPVRLKAKQIFFLQGSPADSVFYLQSGRAKLTVVSERGKEATITLFTAGDFLGEEAIAGVRGNRTATATAITACTALKIRRDEMVRMMHEEHGFADLFLTFLLGRGMRTQADLVDQLFNSSERRLARILLLMADLGKSGETETVIPRITQETLAEMVGTTRSRVSFFMNRFRESGFIDYDGDIRVHRSLLRVILEDQPPGRNAVSPSLPPPTPPPPRAAEPRSSPRTKN
jgi:CRP-like cAMP-binding protein